MEPVEYFYLESELNGKVLDVSGDNPAPGTPVIVYSKKKEVSANQLWYQDENGIIRSKINSMGLDIGPKDQIRTGLYSAHNPNMQWMFTDGRIHLQDRPGTVLDVKGAGWALSLQQPVIAYNYHGKNNQKWRLVDA